MSALSVRVIGGDSGIIQQVGFGLSQDEATTLIRTSLNEHDEPIIDITTDGPEGGDESLDELADVLEGIAGLLRSPETQDAWRAAHAQAIVPEEEL